MCDTSASCLLPIFDLIQQFARMIVADTLRSARFYADRLGFQIAAAGPLVSSSDPQPEWILLRRDTVDLMLHARASWPSHVIQLHPSGSLTLSIPGANRESFVDPDGVRIDVVPEPLAEPLRRAA